MNKKIVGFMPSSGDRICWLRYTLPKLDIVFSQIPNFIVYVFLQGEKLDDFGVFKFIQKTQEDIGLYARKQTYIKELLEIDPTITHIFSIDDDITINSNSTSLVENFIQAFNAIKENQADVIHLNIYSTFHLRKFELLDLEMQTPTFQRKGIIFPVALYFNDYPWPKQKADQIYAGEDNFTFILCLYNNFRVFIAYGFEDFLHLSKTTTFRCYYKDFIPFFSGLLHDRENKEDYTSDMLKQDRISSCIFPSFFARPFSQVYLLHPKIFQIIQQIKEGTSQYNKFDSGIQIKSVSASTSTSGHPANSIIDFTYANRWESMWEDAQWFICDLGFSQVVNFILIHWVEFSSASHYHISGSNDGQNWTLFKTEYEKYYNSTWTDIAFRLNAHFRYFKFDFLKRNSQDHGFSIHNILFYD